MKTHPPCWLINAAKWVKSSMESALLLFVRKLLRVKTTTLPHAVNVSNATYSPWLGDAAFEEVLMAVKHHTTLDVYRLHELWSLIEQLKDIPGDILEVGVYKGGSGALLAEKCRRENITCTLHLCDTFKGVVKARQHDNKYKGGEFSDTSAGLVRDLLKRMQLDNATIYEGIFPDEVAARIPDVSFRLCHIDVDTYESARQVTEWIWPKLSQGGAVVYDDYGFVGCEGVTKFVNQIKSDKDKLFIHNLNGHALVFKVGS